MKQFKTIDVWISMILIFSFVIYGCCRQDEYFLTGYFVVGGWQVISMLVHYFNKWFCEAGTKRRNYHFTVFTIFILAGAGIIFTAILYLVLIVLLFAAPVMAIFYTWLCYDEVYVKMQRPLDLLK
ncbi:hypothetical protein [Ferruginibacter sp.]